MGNLDKAYWDVVKPIMWYLKGTKKKCLCYGKFPLKMQGLIM